MMSVMSSLWSSHLAGWPWWTATEGRPSATPPHRFMNNQQNTGRRHPNLQVLFWHRGTSRDPKKLQRDAAGCWAEGGSRGRGWGWPGDRWERTCCQTGRRATKSTAEGSKVLIYHLESGELSSWSHPSELLQGKSQASVGDFFLHFWWFFRPQVDAHIWGRLPLLSYRCVEGNGGDLSSLWCCSTVFSQSTG